MHCMNMLLNIDEDCPVVHGLLTAENKTLQIRILPISKDPMMAKITHHTHVSFFVEIRTFQFAAASLFALFVVS